MTIRSLNESPTGKQFVPPDIFRWKHCSIEFPVAKINFALQNFRCCMDDCSFQPGSQTFQCRRFGAHIFQYRDVLTPIRFVTVKFSRRRRRIQMFCGRHGLFFSYETFCKNFFYTGLTRMLLQLRVSVIQRLITVPLPALTIH